MVAFLISTISIGVVFLYGCVGEILTEKSGNLNLGIPGIMSVGAAGGCLGVSLYMGGLSDTADANYFLVILSAVLMSALFSAALGAVYSFLTVSLRCNQNVTGLTVTTFGVGLTTFMMESVVDRSRLSAASTLIKLNLPFAESLGVVGEVFFSHGIFVYLAIVIAIVCGWILNRTRIGLNLRAVGENPAAADAALAEIFQVPMGTPLLNMEEVDYDIDGHPVFCSNEYFVDGIFRHTVMRKKL